MKKFAKLIALVLALVLVLSLAACGKGEDKAKADPSGTYKMDKVNGESVRDAMLKKYGSDEAFKELSGMTIDEYQKSMSMTLNKDGTMTVSFNGESETGTWTLNGSELTMTEEDGSKVVGTYENGRITAEMAPGQVMEFVRVG